jgi:hypothetical protein
MRTIARKDAKAQRRTRERSWSQLPGLAILLLLPLVCGCHRGTRPDLGLVHGRVTLDGQPLPDAVVSFTPDGRGRNSTAFTGGDGAYSLNYIRDVQGAVIAWHTVRITTGDRRSHKPELVPERYNAKSQLRQQVTAGKNTIDFALVSE